jgi:hypothetical protein
MSLIPSAPRGAGRSIRRLATLDGVVALFMTLLGPALPGHAAAGLNDPPACPHNIIAFPVRDFVHGDGYAPTTSAVPGRNRVGVMRDKS